jgi:hypothetical protein
MGGTLKVFGGSRNSAQKKPDLAIAAVGQEHSGATSAKGGFYADLKGLRGEI